MTQKIICFILALATLGIGFGTVMYEIPGNASEHLQNPWAAFLGGLCAAWAIIYIGHFWEHQTTLENYAEYKRMHR